MQLLPCLFGERQDTSSRTQQASCNSFFQRGNMGVSQSQGYNLGGPYNNSGVKYIDIPPLVTVFCKKDYRESFVVQL